MMYDFNSLVALLLGILLTILLYVIGLKLYQRYHIDLFTPNIFGIVSLVIIMSIFRIDYAWYEPSATAINFFLKPAVVVLALPLYRRLPLLMKNKLPILLGIFSGVLVSSFSIVFFSFLGNFDMITMLSLLPKSITTPMGIEVSQSMQAIPSITVLAILITGVVGTVLAKTILSLGNIHHPIAKGVAIGTSAHVLGTTKALEIGEVEGAISGLSLALAGIISVFYLPFLAYLIRMIYKMI